MPDLRDFIVILLSKFDLFDVKQDRYVEINLNLLFGEKYPFSVI